MLIAVEGHVRDAGVGDDTDHHGAVAPPESAAGIRMATGWSLGETGGSGKSSTEVTVVIGSNLWPGRDLDNFGGGDFGRPQTVTLLNLHPYPLTTCTG